jgi:hypothetical protein
MKCKSLLPTARLLTFLQLSVLFPLEQRNFKGSPRGRSTGNRYRKAIMECLARGILRSCNSLPWMFAAVMQIRWLCSIVVLTFGIALMGVMPIAAQSGCQPLDDAMNKVMTVPTHIYTVMSSVPSNGAKPRTDEASRSETIYVSGSVYAKVGGHWSRGDWTPQQIMKQEQENRQHSKYICRYLRDESVNGETAAVYATHSEGSDTGHTTSDGQVWISKSRGLPLRDEVDIDSGGPAGKNHYSGRYEYTNVQPPL